MKVNDVVRKRCLISGRVQGVFFRYVTAEEARARGVAGWVRNLPDGRVEAAFEGSPGRVEEMVAWCRHGPDTALVETVEVVSEDVRGDTEFAIRD